MERALRGVKTIQSEHGDCNVPVVHKSLGRWVANQRSVRRQGKLSDERIQKMDQLGFFWGKSNGTKAPASPQDIDQATVDISAPSKRQAPTSEISAPSYVKAAIDAAIDEQFNLLGSKSDDPDEERINDLAMLVNALSDPKSSRYSALSNILRRGHERRSDNVKILLALCIRTLKAN